MSLRFSPARGASILVSSSSRGPTGAAATIAAGTTTTLAEGNSASVSNSGSSSAATFNFSIPRGAIPAIGYNFSTITTDTDPGPGNVQFNSAAVASVTRINFDNVDRDGNTATSWLDFMDDSTSTTKGVLVITPAATPSAKLVYTVSGSVVDGTGYRKVTVAWQLGATLPTNAVHLAFEFIPNGAKGTDGNGTFPGLSVDSEIVLFSGTGGSTVKRASTTGIVKAASGVIGAAAAGTDYCAATSGSSVLKGSSGNTTAATAGTDYMKPDTTSTLTAGFTSASVSAGTKSSGTYTFDPTVGAVQHVTNGGAHTFAPPATHGSWMLDYVNNASAGALTTSGWTKVDGDAFDTTNTHAFRCMLSVGNSGSYLSVKRMV